jgi:ATP/maltotriose-dependent transcriptional regulator MalT
VVRGSALSHLGRREEGIAEIRRSVEQQDAMGSKLERPYCLTLLAEALLGTGHFDEALRLCDQAQQLAAVTEGRSFEAETHRVRGLAIAGSGGRAQESEALAEFQKAIRSASEWRCQLLYSRVESTLRRFGAVGVRP